MDSSPTAGITGKGGIWREKPPDAESAVGARIPESVGNARTCPVQPTSKARLSSSHKKQGRVQD